MSFNAQRKIAYGSNVIALSTIVAGTTTKGSVILSPGDDLRIANETLYMHVSAVVHTTSLTVATGWQVSDDGTNYYWLYTEGGVAYSQIAPTGTGTTATTAYRQKFSFDPTAFRYVVPAVYSAGATGGASDNITIYCGWTMRQQVACL